MHDEGKTMTMVDHNESVLGDNPTDEDKLGFAEPAARLADKIARFPADTPMVVGVEGKWGEGKSSFLLMMKKHWREQACLAPTGFWEKLCQFFPPKGFCARLRQFFQEKELREKPARQIKLIEFDPWWFSGKENLLDKLLKELEGQEPWWRLKLRGLLKGLEKQANTENKWVNGGVNAIALGLASGASAILNPILDWLDGDLLISIKSWLQDGRAKAALVLALFWVLQWLLKQFIAWLSPPEGFEARKKKLEELLKKDRFQRVVFIDDLDRLPVDELQEMFRVIKSVANFPNVVYMLAYDREVVSTGLDKFHPGRGELFLEKIVQMPIALPVPTQYALEKFFQEIFSNVPIWKEAAQKAYQQKSPDGWDLIYTAMIPHARQAKRLRNALMQEHEHALKIDPALYIFLEALRLYSSSTCNNLCHAMLEYNQYPSNDEINIEAQKIYWENNRKQPVDRTPSQEKWMLQAGLLSEPFSSLPARVIECIAFFTLTPFSRPDGSIYNHTPSRMIDTEGTNSELLRKNEIHRACLCYLQARYSEDDPTDAQIEKIISIDSKDALRKFLCDWPFRAYHRLQHAISSYLYRLPVGVRQAKQENLYFLAKLIAETMEERKQYKPSDSNEEFHATGVYRSIFDAVSEYIPRHHGSDATPNLKDLHENLVESTPLFMFDFYQFKKMDSDEIVCAILEKYRPVYILPLLDIDGYSRPYCINTFWEIFVKSRFCISRGLSQWLADLPDSSMLSDRQSNCLKQWMLDSLQREKTGSQLFQQPKLAYLIEPIRQELEKERDVESLQILNAILEKKSAAE